MDMPEALERKLTDFSCSEIINKVGGFSGLIFFALKHTKSVKNY